MNRWQTETQQGLTFQIVLNVVYFIQRSIFSFPSSFSMTRLLVLVFSQKFVTILHCFVFASLQDRSCKINGILRGSDSPGIWFTSAVTVPSFLVQCAHSRVLLSPSEHWLLSGTDFQHKYLWSVFFRITPYFWTFGHSSTFFRRSSGVCSTSICPSSKLQS